MAVGVCKETVNLINYVVRIVTFPRRNSHFRRQHMTINRRTSLCGAESDEQPIPWMELQGIFVTATYVNPFVFDIQPLGNDSNIQSRPDIFSISQRIVTDRTCVYQDLS